MNRNRIYINSIYRDGLLAELDKNKILRFNVIAKKDIFLFAVSLGLNNPKKIQGKKDGYFLLDYLKMSDKALFGTIKLGELNNHEEIDYFANEESSYDFAEQCAETGFEILKEMYESADSQEIFEKRLMAQLDALYMKNINS